MPSPARQTVTLPRTRTMTPARVQAIVSQTVTAAVTEALAAAHADAKKAEDRRASKRNRNRMYMLTVTIANTFLAVWFLHAVGLGRILTVFPMAPIVMGLVFDLGLAGWSWWRKL